jgi:DNA-binding Lrp family transcriptional regulator
VSRFTTELDPAALGLDLQALISVGIRAGQRHLMSSFQTEVRALPGVVQVFFLSGAEDFIIHLAVRNSAEVREFVLQHLSVHPAVASTRTSMVFDHEYNGFLAGAASGHP